MFAADWRSWSINQNQSAPFECVSSDREAARHPNNHSNECRQRSLDIPTTSTPDYQTMTIKARLERLEKEMTPNDPLLVWIERFGEADKTKIRAGGEEIDLGEEMELDDAIE